MTGAEFPHDVETGVDPMLELDRLDEAVRLAGEDEDRTHFDDDVAPRPHSMADPDEPVADQNGVSVDLMTDTPTLEEDLGLDVDADLDTDF